MLQLMCAIMLGVLANVVYAAPLVVLPVGEVSRLSYAGQELFHDTNLNGLPDVGEVFEGVVNITKIVGAQSGIDLSAQLQNVELTSRFRFTITAHSPNFAHLEF